MDELDPEIAQRYSDAAVAPLYTFERFFKNLGVSRAQTRGWKRMTQLPNATYAQHGAEFVAGPSVAGSVMALEFRNGVLAIKAEVHDMEDGEFTDSYEIGHIVSYAAYNSKFFWPALMGYITESEEVISQNQQPGRVAEVLRVCHMLFERHIRKYADAPPAQD